MGVTEPTKNLAGKVIDSISARTAIVISKHKSVRRNTQQSKRLKWGLPAAKHYPMTQYQAASYLGITASAFDYRRKKLELEPSGTYEGKQGTGFLFDMETIIAVYRYSQTDDSDEE